MNRLIPTLRLLTLVAVIAVVGIFADTHKAYAATQIYYSVGQNTTDHKTGSPTLDISSGVGTFSVAQTATNMGVGDKVTFNTSNVCYISGKQSTSVWNLITATGTTCANVTGATVNSIAHAFSSLNSAIGNGVANNATSTNYLNTSDLVAGNYQLNIPCYYDTGPDTTAVIINGLTTDSTHYLRIYTATSTTSEVNQSQRHAGVWVNSGVYVSPTITLTSDFIRIDGLLLALTVTGTFQNGISINSIHSGATYFLSNNIIKGVLSGTANNNHGIQSYFSSGVIRTLYIWNNIIYGFSNGAQINYAIFIGNGDNVYIYNNSIYGNYYGITRSSGNIVAKNNVFSSNSFPAFGTFVAGTDYNSTASTSMGYTVTGGGNTHDRVSQTFSFVDSVNSNFHLTAADTGAKDLGVNLSADPNLAFSTDIDGDARPQGSAWDIGADEVAASITPPR